MNQSFLNPFATPAIPESVHQVIAPNAASACLCAAFNPRGLFAGHYIASARADCAVAIYDLETKGLVRYLEGHTRPVTSIAWSDSGRFLASASLDWNVVLWDLKAIPSARIRTLRFDGPVSQVSFAPGTSKILLVTLESQQCIVVDLRRRKRQKVVRQDVNGVSDGMDVDGKHHSEAAAGPSRAPWQTVERRFDLAKIHAQEIAAVREEDTIDCPDGLPPITTAVFHPSGAYVIAGTTRGDVLTFSFLRGGKLVNRSSVSGSSAIREIAIDRSGRNLVVNSNDRSVRVVAIEMPIKALTNGHAHPSAPTQPESGIHVQVVHRFQDLVNRTPWNGIGFSGDGEYVYAGAAHQAAHNVYIWDRGAGALDKILEGPREPLVDVDWHPTRPLLLSVSVSGSINIWFTPNAENWSAYAPGFEELEENIEYQEGEDEFDLEDEDELSRRKKDEEEADVDVLTLGPLPGGSNPRPLAGFTETTPTAGGLDDGEQTASENVEAWDWDWQDDPEQRNEDFALYVHLDEPDQDEFL